MTTVGTRHAVEVVRELMTCVPPRGESRPVLVFEGPRGSGKTTLLNDLASLLDGRVPYAHIDLAAPGHASTPEVLSAIAFRLSRPCPLYGTMRFPRLAVGQLVMNDAALDLSDGAKARDRINTLLIEHRRIDKLAASLENTAGNLPASLPVTAQVSAGLLVGFLATVVRWLAIWPWSGRFVLGAAQRWYGRLDNGLPAVDNLIDLNEWHRQPDVAGNARRRDEMLWAAFHADLYANLRRRKLARRDGSLRPWVPRCVVLLDNAHTTLGQHVLTELVEIQTERGPAAEDLLAVVATSREPLVDKPSVTNRALGPGLSLSGGPAAQAGRWPAWVTYPLSDLTEVDVVRKAKLDHVQLDPRLPFLIHQFAQGSPLATGLLLSTAAQVAGWDDGGSELALVLGRPEPPAPPPDGRQRYTIEERLGRRLLGLADSDTFAAVAGLTACAAARSREEALLMATGSGMVTREAYTGHADDVLDGVWPPTTDVAVSPLRRLLLRRLAARGPDDGPRWAQVHGWLRIRCTRRDDRIGELYHALAAGDLKHVAEQFAERCSNQPAAEWLADVQAVVCAPAEQPHLGPPSQEAHRLARETGTDPDTLLGRVTQLIGGLWLAADPFTSRHRAELHKAIARDYLALITYFPSGHSLLTSEAARHDAWADRWR